MVLYRVCYSRCMVHKKCGCNSCSLRIQKANPEVQTNSEYQTILPKSRIGQLVIGSFYIRGALAMAFSKG